MRPHLKLYKGVTEAVAGVAVALNYNGSYGAVRFEQSLELLLPLASDKGVHGSDVPLCNSSRCRPRTECLAGVRGDNARSRTGVGVIRVHLLHSGVR